MIKKNYILVFNVLSRKRKKRSIFGKEIKATGKNIFSQIFVNHLGERREERVVGGKWENDKSNICSFTTCNSTPLTLQIRGQFSLFLNHFLHLRQHQLPWHSEELSFSLCNGGTICIFFDELNFTFRHHRLQKKIALYYCWFPQLLQS